MPQDTNSIMSNVYIFRRRRSRISSKSKSKFAGEVRVQRSVLKVIHSSSRPVSEFRTTVGLPRPRSAACIELIV